VGSLCQVGAMGGLTVPTEELPPIQTDGTFVQLPDLFMNDLTALLNNAAAVNLHWPPSSKQLELTQPVIDTLRELQVAMNGAGVAFVRELGDDEVDRWRLELNAARSHGRGRPIN
jgi:hypothetical protein